MLAMSFDIDRTFVIFNNNNNNNNKDNFPLLIFAHFFLKKRKPDYGENDWLVGCQFGVSYLSVFKFCHFKPKKIGLDFGIF